MKSNCGGFFLTKMFLQFCSYEFLHLKLKKKVSDTDVSRFFLHSYSNLVVRKYFSASADPYFEKKFEEKINFKQIFDNPNIETLELKKRIMVRHSDPLTILLQSLCKVVKNPNMLKTF